MNPENRGAHGEHGERTFQSANRGQRTFQSADPQGLTRVRELAQRVADDLADEAAIAELDSLLRDSAEARAAYLGMMDLHFDLERRAILAAPETLDRPRSTKLVAFPKILAAAAAVALAATGAWWFSRPAPPVATLVKTAADVWSTAPDDRVLRDGRDFELLSGLVQLETTDGVHLILEGPATGRFESVRTLHLEIGKLYAEVPEQGRGFTVETPAGRAVDLGTRFAVDASSHAAEIQVFEGKVVAELAEKSNELGSGQAVRLDAGLGLIEPAPYNEDKFTQIIGTFHEPFVNHPEGDPLAGHRGWHAAGPGLPAEEIRLNDRALGFPGLAAGSGGALEIWPKRKSPATPVGHRWPFAFTSAVIQMDDDLIKGLSHKPDDDHVVLLSFGPAHQPDPERLRLVVTADPSPHSEHGRLGLAAGGDVILGPDSYHATQVHFLVLQIGENEGRLWINPDPELFGTEEVPEPDVVIPLPDGPAPKNLWIGNSPNPTFTYWWLDELRGAHTWAEATPAIDSSANP